MTRSTPPVPVAQLAANEVGAGRRSGDEVRSEDRMALIEGSDEVPGRLLRIQEAADEVGLTPRSIRYYEELGLLRPAARSGGDYRLYDASDVERLRFIKGLRDDAGFSLAEIAQLLEDEAARQAARTTFRQADDPAQRRAAVADTLARVERQVDTLRAKAERIAGMIEEAERRREHLRQHIADLDAGRSGLHPLSSETGRERP